MRCVARSEVAGLFGSTGSAGTVSGGQRERTLQETNGSRHVLLGSEEDADPPGIRKVVVRLGFAGSDEFITHRFREGNIEQPIAVNVPEFAPAETKLETSIAVRLDLHVSPLAGCIDQTFLCPWNGHRFLLF